MSFPIHELTPRRVAHLLIVLYILSCSPPCKATVEELLQGFKATPDPSVSKFQPLLSDSSGNFSLGFLRVNQNQLALTVLHVPSFQPFWQLDSTHLAGWSDTTWLFFNGSLVIADPSTRVFWSTETNGDRVVLLNNSNLQVEKLGKQQTVLWQSFDFPRSTIVENQNFTANMTLISANDLYTMRLGEDFIGLYAKFSGNNQNQQIYWRHKALEAKADIVDGKGPIYARVNSGGYLGMYQAGTIPVDVEAFRTFQRPIDALLIVRLESDGNLRGYYWDGNKWLLNYEAITTQCELPGACGSFGLCNPGKGCSCLSNQTGFHSERCLAPQTGDFCGGLWLTQTGFSIMRRNGVELPYKELMRYVTTSSMEQCEGLCEKNCTCRGAVYNNASGFCYLVDYPIQTLVGVADDTKMGYFKIKERSGGRRFNSRLGIGIGALCGAVLIFSCIVGFWSCRAWRRKRRGVKGVEGIDLRTGPYKRFGSDSFRSTGMGDYNL